MAVAFLSAQRSKDPSSQVQRQQAPGQLQLTLNAHSPNHSSSPSSLPSLPQVGACIVNPEHKIVGIGYNGMPNNCSDDELPWQREGENRLDTKYPYGEWPPQ